ncbi:hypothetical protein F4813DRAFT_394276 [Daldinia decipiens]|uniref:uncharacterized protein n=1 Tax=Daldinia decipiens TaxID=326647 RepID=UPI0020C48FB6|nr:uncharacterized protein F4813DRAFT_394276 [Daldinia decipiens]KAI1652828.1 hypothetical protein F4813DRAFT_394276 [Daldinia decipiens]
MDPFSIATGVAGLVSLGLTVSGGLIQYCKDYKSQDTDLVKLTQHAQELESLLSLIENRTTGSQSPNGDITTSLQKCRDACDACLRDFKQMNAKYTGSKPGQTFKGRGRKLLHDLKYPFDKGKFDDCRFQLQEFNARLLGYLQLVNLDLTRDMRCTMVLEFAQVTTAVDSVARQLQSSISDANNAVTSTIRDSVDQLGDSFQRSIQKTESNMINSMAASLHSLSDNFEQGQERQTSIITYQLERIIQMVQTQNTAQTAGPSVENRVALDTHSMKKSYQDRSAMRTPSSVMSGRAGLCDCPKARHGYSSTRHKKDCLYSFTNKKKRTFSMRFQAFRHQVIWTWQIEYSPLAWARSCQIHRNLTLRATVPNSAPAFRIISKMRIGFLFKNISTTQELGRACQNYLVELQHIFANGMGWPTDVNEYGHNLIHETLPSTYWYLSRLKLVREEKLAGDEELSTILLQFLKALVLMGAPINDVDKFGNTPLYTIIHHTTLNIRTHMINELVDAEATVGENYNPDKILRFLSLNNPSLYDNFSCAEFLYEVLLRSESSFVRLRTDPSLIFERTREGQTAFHLAANWPRGISTLIKSAGWAIKYIINAEDTNGNTALSYAVMLDEPDSVRLLLDADAIIEESIIWDLHERWEVIQIIVTYLAQLQTGLLKLALQNLPAEIIDKLRLKEDETLDFGDKAFDVVKALRQQQVPIPDIYHIPKVRPVYHWLSCNASIAQMLFDAGFHGTDTIFSGYTPLMTLSYYYHGLASCLELVCWFEDHGADLHTPIPIPGRYTFASNPEGLAPIHPTIHKALYDLGQASCLLINTNMKLSTEIQPRFAKLLQDEYADPCLCYCTLSGCTSASKYARAVFEVYGTGPPTIIPHWQKVTEGGTIGYNKSVVILGLIRVITFDELGMKHTCCSYRMSSFQGIIEQGLLILMEPAEIEEIREEDRYLAKQLDALMEEFEAKLQEMDWPLSRFIEEYWEPRMGEVKKERDKLSADALHAIKEIGVVLEES